MKRKMVWVVSLAALCLVLLVPAVVYASGAFQVNQRNITRTENNLDTAIRNYNRRLDRYEILIRRQEDAFARLIARQERAEARLIRNQMQAQYREIVRIFGVYEEIRGNEVLVTPGLVHRIFNEIETLDELRRRADGRPEYVFRTPSRTVLPYVHGVLDDGGSLNEFEFDSFEHLRYTIWNGDGERNWYVRYGELPHYMIDAHRARDWNTRFAVPWPTEDNELLTWNHFVSMRRGGGENCDETFGINNDYFIYMPLGE